VSKSKLVPLSLMVLSRQEINDLARRRGIQTPKVYKDGDLWKIRVYRDAINAEGKPYRSRPEFTIGPATGPGKLTEKQANTAAYETVLKQVNSYAAVPQSVMTLEQFVSQKFQPNCVDNLKKAGQEHYSYCLSKILPVLGQERLRDIDTQVIQNLCKGLLRSGKAVKTVSHVKTAMSAIFRHAKEEKLFVGDNPASYVKLPEVVSAEKYAYSFVEAQTLLDRLRQGGRVKEQIMALLSMTTSLNVAELCGLRWKRLNLTEGIVQSAGETLPPFSLVVREDFYRGVWGTVKTNNRRRTIGIPDLIIPELVGLKQDSEFSKPEDVVFSSSRGTPLDAHNVNSRVFRPLASELGFPVSWHLFRHSAATFAEQVDMPLSDREKLMGHARAHQTAHYTHSDVVRRRRFQNVVASQLRPPTAPVAAGSEPDGSGDPGIAELERLFSLEEKK
jgi:integrase